MGRSSRILGFLALVIATPAFGFGGTLHAGGMGMGMRAPMMRAPMVRPPLARPPLIMARPRVIGPGYQPALRRGFVAVPQRRLQLGAYGLGRGRFGGFRGRRFAGGGLGYDGDFTTLQPPFVGGGADDGGAYVIPADVPRCIRPQIIQIGRGLRKAAKTRVVYGPPQGCVD